MIFLILGGQIHDFWVILGGPGAHFGGLGTHFDDISDFCDFRDVFGTKGVVPFWGQNRPRTHVLQCCFSMFFWVPIFLIFWDLGCPEAPFWLHFDSFLGALGLWKNSWKCVTIVKFRGLAPSKRSLFAGLDQEGVLMTSFSRFLRFCAFLRLPFGHLLAPVVVKKQVRKNDAKSVIKWVYGFCE